ncbi:MAG: tetratricopeptide repeat protein, partial [Candidatus Omnitrophota bacterium]
STALLAAVLFCVHPVKSEAVCSIGYRADSLAFFFALLSFIVFILHDRFTRPKKDIVLGVSWLFFALALFSKESAIVLPALIIAYDGYFRRDSWVTLARNFRARYGGHVLIAGIYLFLYFFVFRNLTLPNSRLFNNSLSVHVVTMAQIFWFYAVDLIFPFSIKMVPPVYAPPIDGFTLYRVIFSAGLLAALVYAGVRMSRSARPVSFFILWFLLGLLPVSNLIALPNPMAHRFLYLPSLGFLAVVAIAIEWLSVQIDRFRPLPHLSKILKTGLVALLILTTYSLNIFWRSDYTVAAELVERYPRDPKGYFFLGLVYFQHGLFENAKVLLNKSVELGTSDPRAFYTLGLCYSVFGRDFDRATEAFNKCIAVYPDFALPYIGVGRILLLQGDREKALPYFQKSLKLSPTYSAYGYLIQTFLLEGRTGEAEELLQEASAVLADQQDLRSLTRMLEQKDTPDYPVDIGI